MPIDIDAFNAWLKGLAELTFPIAVASFLLFKGNKTLEGLRITIDILTIEVKVGMGIVVNKLDAQEEYEKELELALARAANIDNRGGKD
ncbi:hypothetical protein LCGC14_0665640 [marine sediment metagenome]|uniref:Uncharacterized protein n=1 Tax=marine sediment metagenome TaxID=412755 RepID=A0A0F9U0I6_9ZZZZ